MRILHRGLTIELADDDARIGAIEEVLFGRRLEVEVAAAAKPEETPSPAAATTARSEGAPRLKVSERWRAFWGSLGPKARRELVLLAEKPRRPVELEHLLGLRYGSLKGRHAEIHRCATKHGVPCTILARGRGRAARHFHVTPEGLPIVQELARRQAIIDAE